jgi:lipopolysaccharide assembly outer membrane protein LptD (OstA)
MNFRTFGAGSSTEVGSRAHGARDLRHRVLGRAMRAAFLGLVLTAAAATAARAQGSLPASLSANARLPVDIVADQIDYLSADNVYTAEGRVKIRQKGRTLTANWVMLDVESRIGVASGNVRLTDGKDVIYSEFMEFNIDTLVGVVYRGRFEAKETNFKITGEEIRRRSDKEYRLKEGTFTTCDCGPGNVPSWRIEGDSVDVTVDGYAKVRGTKFKIKNTPVAYVPFGIFPVKTTRQSGLLFPAIGNSSRNGFEFNLPYYWAISENTDATFYQDFLAKRGLKEGVEFRYIFQPETYGQANIWYLHDRDVDDETPFGPDRWAAKWEHNEKFPWGIYGKADVNNISDNRYVIDFSDLGRDSNRFLESRGHLYRPFDKGIVTLGALYGDDLQSPDDLDRDKFVLNRFPFITADALDQPVLDTPLRFQMGSSFVNFHQGEDPAARFSGLPGVNNIFLDTGIDALFDQEEPGFQANDPVNGDPNQDDFHRVVKGEQPFPPPLLDIPDQVFDNPEGTEGNGLFEEGEILANSGQRYDFYPRVSLPFQAGKYLNFRPELGWRETIWRSDDFSGGSSSRDLFTARLDMNTQLEKDWKSPFSRWESIHQTFKPGITFVSIQGSDDEAIDGEDLGFQGKNLISVDHPVFVPPGSTNQSRQRYFAFENVLEDQSDVITDQTLIYYMAENQFFTKEKGADGTSRRVLRVRTGTGYDPENSRAADSIMEATFEPTDNLELNSDATYNNVKNRVDHFNIGGGVSDNRGDYLKLGYRLSRSFAPAFEEFRGDPDFEDFNSGFDEISELNTNLRLRLLSNVDFLYRSNYSFNVGEFFRQAYSVIYRSKCECWSANVSVVDRARAGDTQVRVLVNLEGLGAIGNASNP